MSLVPTPTSVPAGWYPDPQGSFQQRWWNGTSWTNEFAQYRPTLNYTPAVQHAVAQATPAQLQAAAQVAAAQTAFAESRLAASAAQYESQQASVQTLAPVQTLTSTGSAVEDARTSAPVAPQQISYAENPGFAPIPQFASAMPSASSAALIPSTPAPSQQPTRAVNPSYLEDYQPFGTIPQIRSGVRDRPTKRNTAAAFLLALLPALFLGAAIAMSYFLPEYYTAFALGGIGLVLLAALIICASVDRRILRDAGHDSAAWAILAAAPPFYFIVRTVVVARETGRGTPFPLVLSILVLASLAAALLVEPRLLALLTPTN